MKKSNKISLCSLHIKEQSVRNMSQFKGGASGNCGCGCAYAGSGGSSSCTNSGANYNGGLTSPGVKRVNCGCGFTDDFTAYKHMTGC